LISPKSVIEPKHYLNSGLSQQNIRRIIQSILSLSRFYSKEPPKSGDMKNNLKIDFYSQSKRRNFRTSISTNLKKGRNGSAWWHRPRNSNTREAETGGS
jgi:hypothetical protein